MFLGGAVEVVCGVMSRWLALTLVGPRGPAGGSLTLACAAAVRAVGVSLPGLIEEGTSQSAR